MESVNNSSIGQQLGTSRSSTTIKVGSTCNARTEDGQTSGNACKSMGTCVGVDSEADEGVNKCSELISANEDSGTNDLASKDGQNYAKSMQTFMGGHIEAGTELVNCCASKNTNERRSLSVCFFKI